MAGDTGVPRERIDIRRFRRHKLEYEFDETISGFRHNFDRDLHLFLIWQYARSRENEILDALAEDFTILNVSEIHWSPDLLSQNYRRLYRMPYSDSTALPGKIGNGSFLAIVIEDEYPDYGFDRTVSGAIECANRRVVEHKYRYRDWVTGFGVHSSNSISEFFEQACLVFGTRHLDQIISAGPWNGVIETLSADLAGAMGWDSPRSLFEVLGLSSNYIVLRNFEELPDTPLDGGEDIDFLCSNLVTFVAAAGATIPNGRRPHRCVVHIAGSEVPLDVRSVGDGYYDAAWQYDLLKRQTAHRGLVGRPRQDDYFFSLLYHAKVQKTNVNPEYVERLPQLAATIGMDWFSAADVVSDESAADVLGGYMEANGYRFVRPADQGVITNRSVLKLMPEVRSNRHSRGRGAAKAIYKKGSIVVPGRLKAMVPGRWKRRVVRSLRL